MQLLFAVGEQPVRHVPQQPARLVLHRVLHFGGDACVEGFDLRPGAAHVEDFARRRVSACDLRRLRARFFLRARHERRPHTIDEAVGGRSRDDFAPQPVLANGATEPFLHGRREVAGQLRVQIRVLGDVRSQQVIVEPDLAVGEQHGQLGTGQSPAAFAPLGDFVIRGQEFEPAVQVAGALEDVDEVLVLREPRLRLQFQSADRLALQIVVAQYQRRDFIRHPRQQPVTLAPGDLAGEHQRVEQDLDVDFDVGGVDPGRVVDEVGVQPSAGQRVFNAAPLRQAEVATFTHDFGAQFRAVDAHCIVGAVAGVGIRFVAGLDVRADTAVPQQVDAHAQDGADDVIGWRSRCLEPENRPRFGRQRDRLRRAGEYSAAA